MSATRARAVTLVLGGVRSGKSRYARQLAGNFNSVTFIATALATDAEMRRKIAAHRRERSPEWRTVEAPTGLPAAISEASATADVILVDCLTIYVGNQMMDSRHKCRSPQAVMASLDLAALCAAVESAESSIIIVSNEVGSGVVPAFRSGRLYRDLLGELNQRVAGIADRVVLMVAGQPVTIKGEERS